MINRGPVTSDSTLLIRHLFNTSAANSAAACSEDTIIVRVCRYILPCHYLHHHHTMIALASGHWALAIASTVQVSDPLIPYFPK